MSKKILLTVIFTVHFIFAFAQGEGNVWAFGMGVGLDFNSGSPIAFSPTSIATYEGSATISDANGQLLFYTDGIYVWDKLHNQMPSSSNLGGNSSSTQSAIIVNLPGSTTIYYIFSVDAQAGSGGGSGGLNYSIVDMTLNGGLGDVTTQNVLMLTPTCEKISAARASNGIDWWIVTHEWNNNQFDSYKLTAGGLNMVPVVSVAGMVHSDVGSGNNAETIGYMKISNDGQKLGLVCYEALNIFELFGFDNNTGMITGLIASDTNFPNASGYTGPYGFSFSPDNTKAYVAVFGYLPDPSEVWQYDITSGVSATILASKFLVNSSTTEYYGALQAGVDQKIYLAKSGVMFLDALNTPNVSGAGCGFVLDAVSLPNTCQLGLPNIYEGFLVTAGLQATLFYQGCTGNDFLQFIDSIFNDTYTVHWDFGVTTATNDTSNLASPTFNFPGPGNYTVTITVTFSLGGTYVVTNNISIGGALPLNIGNDTTICSNTPFQLDAGVANATYSWTPIATLSCNTCQNPIANPTAITTYFVTVTTLYCTGSDSIIIDLFPATIATAYSDTSICIGTSALLMASGGTAFKWWPNIELTDTFSQVITATPITTTTYFVEVDAQNNCPKDTASVVVTIWPLPLVDAGLNITLTEGELGKLSGVSPTGISNWWLSDFGLSDSHVLDPSFTALNSITYHLYSFDANGCINSDSVQVLVEPAFLLFPNGFSPNADNVNDLFVYFDKGVSAVQLSIFNRWGELVFYSNVKGEFWDGTQKDQPAPVGVYVYQARAKTWSGRNLIVKGNVAIIK